jgi:hypothetical protein
MYWLAWWVPALPADMMHFLRREMPFSVTVRWQTDGHQGQLCAQWHWQGRYKKMSWYSTSILPYSSIVYKYSGLKCVDAAFYFCP